MRVLNFGSLVGLMLALATGCAEKEMAGAPQSSKDAPNTSAKKSIAKERVHSEPTDVIVTGEGTAKDAPPLGPTGGSETAKIKALEGKTTEALKADRAKSADKASEKSREVAAADALVAAAPKGPGAWKAKAAPEPQSGRLTAGSFDDNLFPDAFRRFASKMGQESSSSGLTGKLFGRRLIVTVKGKDGQPLGNARVRINGNDGNASVELVTRSDGRVVFVASWDNVDGDLTVTVTPPDGSAPISQAVDRETGRCEVALPATPAPLPKNLDLLLVLDTTGSMGDELAYLKSEFKTIASTIAARFPNVSQRYGLVVYRDRGDEYVARRFDFTPSVDEFRARLGAQSAAGGGDYPEAMEVGLEEAVKLQWRTTDTARVMFLVADAPPHAQDIGKTMAQADALRKKGVAIYPLACSGYDPACELVMRSCAMLTGGQFLFLTDDSGVGEAHGEPHIPFYHVERQAALMVRMVAGELLGRRLDPVPEEIIRTVGSPPKMKGQ
jgi:von Willebrand factor type A domain